MALACRVRKAVRWTLGTVASVIAVGTVYLILSPDPLNDVGEDWQAGTLSGPVLVCDDASWEEHRMAVIVPFRDRFDELLEFAPYLHRFLCAQRVRHQIFVINQVDPFRFNRASLINVGFLLTESMFDYIAIHDVDLIPVNQNVTYHYPALGPYHVSAPGLHPKYYYEKFLGGILLITREHFRSVRGFSNNFWGWGREDDEFYRRIKDNDLQILRPEGITTGNQTFRHLHDGLRRQRDGFRYGDQRTYMRRDWETGVDTVTYSVKSQHQVRVDGLVDVTVINIHLNCVLEATPWCLTPRQLTSLMAAERARLPPDKFARLEESLNRHGIVYDRSKT